MSSGYRPTDDEGLQDAWNEERAALAEQPAPVLTDDEQWRLQQVKEQWADGKSGSLAAAQAYINGLETCLARAILAAAIPPGHVVVKDEPVAHVSDVHLSRYTLEWTNGPLAEGTALYARPGGQG